MLSRLSTHGRPRLVCNLPDVASFGQLMVSAGLLSVAHALQRALTQFICGRIV